jgi:hypothetical protein
VKKKRACVWPIFISKCHHFKWSSWNWWQFFMVVTFTYGSSKCTWCFQTWTLEGFFYWSTTILDGDDEMISYKEKATKVFVFLCDHFVHVQRAHIQFWEDVKSVWDALCDVHEVKTIQNNFVLWKFFTIKCKKEINMLVQSTWWRSLQINYNPLKWTLKMKTYTCNKN